MLVVYSIAFHKKQENIYLKKKSIKNTRLKKKKITKTGSLVKKIRPLKCWYDKMLISTPPLQNLMSTIYYSGYFIFNTHL